MWRIRFTRNACICDVIKFHGVISIQPINVFHVSINARANTKDLTSVTNFIGGWRIRHEIQIKTDKYFGSNLLVTVGIWEKQVLDANWNVTTQIFILVILSSFTVRRQIFGICVLVTAKTFEEFRNLYFVLYSWAARVDWLVFFFKYLLISEQFSIFVEVQSEHFIITALLLLSTNQNFFWNLITAVAFINRKPWF